MTSDARLAVEVERVEAALMTAEADAVNARLDAAAALGPIEADLAIGVIDEREAAARRETASQPASEAAERAERLRRALPVPYDRLAAAREQQRQREIVKRRDVLAAALRSRGRAASNVVRALREADSAARELARHRDLVAQAHEALLDALADDPFEWPCDPDEPSLPDVPGLRCVLDGGAEQPRADAKQRADEAERTRARQDAEQLAWFRAHASDSTIAQLPERLHEQASVVLDEVRAERAARAERRRAAERAREAVRLP
jgi:hypothetical protein